jgi:hypothetical protein
LPGKKNGALKQAFMSVLHDYSERVPGDLTGVLLELIAMGFRIHDLSHEADPEHRGMLITKGEGFNIVEIALVSMVREMRDGRYSVNVHRFDRENRVDTLVTRNVTTWN